MLFLFLPVAAAAAAASLQDVTCVTVLESLSGHFEARKCVGERRERLQAARKERFPDARSSEPFHHVMSDNNRDDEWRVFLCSILLSRLEENGRMFHSLEKRGFSRLNATIIMRIKVVSSFVPVVV